MEILKQILKQSGFLKLLSANHCARIKSIFIDHIPELWNQNFRDGAWASEFLTSSPGNNPDAQSLRTSDLDAGIERIGQILLHRIVKYKAPIGFIPRFQPMRSNKT